MPTGAAAQEFLALDSIRENVVLLKDGGLRVILMCSALNFALKSAEEQDAVTFQYQNFLNSLDFPIQFVIHSRHLNIAPYLEALDNRRKDEDSELMKIQIGEYGEFIKTFVEMSSIMSKTFYAVVPFSPPTLETKVFFGSILSLLGRGGNTTPASKDAIFSQYKNQLWQRVDAVTSGLGQFGIRSAPLNTEELIELFYGLYNPTEFENVARPQEK